MSDEGRDMVIGKRRVATVDSDLSVVGMGGVRRRVRGASATSFRVVFQGRVSSAWTDARSVVVHQPGGGARIACEDLRCAG